MWDGFDKRKFPRLNLRCEIIIQSESKNLLPVRTSTENVGAGGVAVILDHPLERFSRCRLRLELDPSLPQIEGTGRVVWTIPTGSPDFRKKLYDTGIEFVDLEGKDHELLHQFVQSRVQKGFREIVP
ncbi:MAG: PilZ domain-containing protein [Candidatus Omnitrophica bacterium]|nr:PilZ domain-containing protein [Candidatus Omnitrophota bacterium]